MRGRAVTILLFLLIGAALNVAVAWACAIGYDPARHPTLFTDVASTEDLAWWSSRKPAEFPDMAVDIATLSRCGLSVRQVVASEEVDIDDFRFCDTFGEMRAGWPMNCLEGSVWLHYDWARGFHKIPDAVLLTTGGSNARWLPVRPIGLGLAVNIVFFGIVLWLVVRGPFVLRACIRRRRGRCINCGYDLRGDLAAGCPECGWNRTDALD